MGVATLLGQMDPDAATNLYQDNTVIDTHLAKRAASLQHIFARRRTGVASNFSMVAPTLQQMNARVALVWQQHMSACAAPDYIEGAL